MPRRNPSINNIVWQISEQITRELNGRLPRKVGVMADRRRKPLISAVPHLSHSIEARPRPFLCSEDR